MTHQHADISRMPYAARPSNGVLHPREKETFIRPLHYQAESLAN
jgi:hypothetical protein